MDAADPDAPTQKRPRLDSANNPPYNGLPPPPPPPARHPTHPSSRASPPPRHHLPTRGLPHPSQQYPPQGPPPGPHSGQGHYHPPHQTHQPHQPHQHPQHHQPHPSSSLPPSDIRAYSDPTTLRPVLSPHQRSHGFPVTIPALSTSVDRDRISDYARPSATGLSSAPETHSRSTSVDVKAQTGMEHGAPSTPWTGNPEHRPNGNFSNGYPRVVSPPQPHEPQYQPPPPSQGQQYGSPVVPYAPGAYLGGSAAQSAAHYAAQNSIRRKQVRATQACNHCRARKQKCDEARPCHFCSENGFDCQYKDVPPPKQDRSMMQLQESVNVISDTLKSFIDELSAWRQNVESRLPAPNSNERTANASNQTSPEQAYPMRGSMSEHSGSAMPTPGPTRNQFRKINSMNAGSPIGHQSAAYAGSPIGHASTTYAGSPIVHQPMASPLPVNNLTPIKQESTTMAPTPQSVATSSDSVRTDHTSHTGDPSKTKIGLQGDHTTPAHQVLQDWKSMEKFCDGVETIKKLKEQGYNISDYPMKLEQDRGLVRVWGVGEGIDRNDGAQGPGPGSPGSADSDTPSPPAGREPLWGKVEPSSPSTQGPDTPKWDPEVNLGGLGPDGQLQLDKETLKDLHNSYYQHIHSLHPFLNPSALRKMVNDFGATYGPEAKRGQTYAGNKRKRSETGFVEPFSPAADNSPGSIERSLRNAIVLLILALGKVCRHKRPLPYPRPDRGPLEGVLWGATRDSPRSANNSFSSDSGPETRPRNIDILPGMAYFSYATDILGNQQGGNTTGHAQAMLLAALYLGQFARVLESWSWINNACRVCLVLIKAEMPHINRQVLFSNSGQPPPTFSDKEQFRLNLIKCVYWTCLQLETDILAEMSTLPPSEISRYQEEVSYPSGVFEKFPETIMYNESTDHEKTMWIYSSQIHLRVILNEAHNTLYSSGRKKSNAEGHDLKEVANAARVHADILMSWRKLLPDELSWDDKEPPSTDLNIARLRAKFYGGYYMILRPFLHIAIHDIALPPAPPSSGYSSQISSPAAAAGTVTTPASTHAQYKGSLMELTPDQSSVLQVASQCISSAIQSTIAFDRVGADPKTPYNEFVDTPKERFVVTNIFGTLHAQFGNMIVLAAVFNSQLKGYLPLNTKLTKHTLGLLYKRTIKMLEEVGPNSPILTVDAQILRNVQRQLELDPC